MVFSFRSGDGLLHYYFVFFNEYEYSTVVVDCVASPVVFRLFGFARSIVDGHRYVPGLVEELIVVPLDCFLGRDADGQLQRGITLSLGNERHRHGDGAVTFVIYSKISE
ncbi:hypothetical protein BRC81_05735 [Halobacteriales archaeon QS_1_68_20]|nr:MAG: hypothetical protein BRC81_05735 [Halobacteriales archaeon QS_1_68_20]